MKPFKCSEKNKWTNLIAKTCSSGNHFEPVNVKAKRIRILSIILTKSRTSRRQKWGEVVLRYQKEFICDWVYNNSVKWISLLSYKQNFEQARVNFGELPQLHKLSIVCLWCFGLVRSRENAKTSEKIFFIKI